MVVSTCEIAKMVEGKLVGDDTIKVSTATSLTNATSSSITFVENPKYNRQFLDSDSKVAIVQEEIPSCNKTQIIVKDALQAFIKIALYMKPPLPDYPKGVSQMAQIGEGVKLGNGCTIMAFARIGEGTIIGDNCTIHSGAVIGRKCKIGNNCTIFPNVVFYDECIAGNEVIIHANSVIGADGFGYRLTDGKHIKVPQLGNVVLQDCVEIGACTTIDRSTFGTTLIGEGSKIDNLVQIGHNCQIGKHNLFVSQVGIAGSCSTGDYVVIAGQAGLADHLNIGERVVIGARSGLMRDVTAGEKLLGAPASPERDEKKILLSLEKLPELCKDVKKLKQALKLSD